MEETIENQETPVIEEPKESRFKETLKKRTYQNIFLAGFGLLALLVIIIVFGTQILIAFSLLIGKMTGKEEPVKERTVQTNYINPPQLDVPVEATNSATINLSGSGTKEQTVTLYRNDRFIDETKISDKQKFSFRSVTLQSGENVFKTKSSDGQNESTYSNAVTINYLQGEPSLSIENPQDGQTFRKDAGQVKVQGKADPGVTVTVNGFRAIVENQGRYTYSYTLTDGDNKLTIVATDDAGNKSTKEVTIKAQ